MTITVSWTSFTDPSTSATLTARLTLLYITYIYILRLYLFTAWRQQNTFLNDISQGKERDRVEQGLVKRAWGVKTRYRSSQ